MKGVKKAKAQLKIYEHDMAQETDTLYGDTIYRALDRRCKSKKRAREISREMQPKRGRLEQPFREAPSRGYTYSQGRGGGVSTYKQTMQRPKRGTESSGFRIPPKNRTGDIRHGIKTRYTSSIGTNNKMSRLNKLHSSVSQIEFKEIHYNNIPLGGGLK